MSAPKWGGSRARRWKRDVLARHGTVCALQLEGCTRVATTADHIVPRSVRLDLQYDPANGRPACLHCNQSRGDGSRDALEPVDARGFFESGQQPRRISAGSPPRSLNKNEPAGFTTRP